MPRAIKLLLVDDDHAGQGALSQLRSHAGVSVLDVDVPEMDARALAELMRETARSAEATRDKDALPAHLGHDLKNPLNTIVMTSQLIGQIATEASVKKHATRLYTTSMRMARMVDDLFDTTRLRAGHGLPLERKACDALSIARSAIAAQETARPEASIRFQSSGDTTGEWDATRLEQVVGNLVGNALQHGAQGKAIDVSLRGDGADVALTVHNEGTIEPSVLPTVFEPFLGGRTPPRRVGLGLGLYVTRQIVQAHGGSIDVSSTESEGTTFVARIPRRAPPQPPSVPKR